MQSIINQFVEIGGISYVFVVDDTGTIIAHTFVPAVPPEIVADYKSGKASYDRKITGMGSFTEVTADILAGEAGSVHVGMDNGFIALQVQKAIGKQVYLLTILFVVSILISFALMYQVSRPLNDLVHYARHAAFPAGEIAAPPAERIKRLLLRVDEIGELGRLLRALIHRAP
ncbi:MAG: hypothetical protein AB7P52_12510 [Alphaproteobacteria bacterium]